MTKNFLLTLLVAFTVLSNSASAVHCTCWRPWFSGGDCAGRIDPFGGDLNACHNACQHYIGGDCDKALLNFCGFIDDISLDKCENKNKILGAW